MLAFSLCKEVYLLKRCGDLVSLPPPHSARAVCTVPLEDNLVLVPRVVLKLGSHLRQTSKRFPSPVGESSPLELRAPRPRPSLIVVHGRLIKLAFPYRFSFKTAGDKGLTLPPDIVPEVSSILAMVGFSSGIHVI